MFAFFVILSNSPLAWSAEAFLQKFSDQDVETSWKFTNESKVDEFSTTEAFSTTSDANGVVYPRGTEWVGMCFDPHKSECTVDDDYSKVLAASIPDGQLKPEERSAMISVAKGMRIRSVTTYRLAGDKLVATCRQEFFKNGAPLDHPYTKEVSMVISSAPFKFTAKASDEDRSRCSEFEKLPTQIQDLADSVVEIVGKSNDDGIGSGAQGSGFFISEKGFLLTNHHVIHSMPSQCAQELKCSLHFRQILGVGKVREFDAPIVLEAESQAQDFALLKVELPADIKIRALALETDKAGPAAFTVGYPADRKAENGTAFTYSSGHLVAMLGSTVQSNVLVSGGASGSPLLSTSSQKVIGIISNSIGTTLHGAEGSLARPIQSIEKSHQLSQYLTGEKQKRVDQMIDKLKVSKSPDEVQRLMSALESENTLHGVSRIEEALYLNPSAQARMIILRGLQKQGILRGTANE